MKRILVATALTFAAATFAQSPPQISATTHPFTFEDMMKLKRLDEPVPSPDGKWVVFSATDVDLEADTRISYLWIVPATGPAAAGRRLNQTPNHEERPRFSPDGKRLIWTSKATDPTQIWMCDFETESGRLVGKPWQLTTISTGADGGIWSPDGKNIVFVSAVYPDCFTDECNKKRDEEVKKSKVKAKIFTRLLYRHWNAFTEFKRSHLFVVSADANRATDFRSVGQTGVSPADAVEAGVSPAGTVEAGVPGGGVAAGGGGSPAPSPSPQPTRLPLQKNEPRDLTPGDHDVPPFHLGGQDMYAISPDGREVAYTSNIDEVEATSTNNEIFIVPITGPAAAGKKISTSPGSDSTPLYSPDGKYIAWRSQARAGFEADKWRLLVQDRQSGKTRELTEKFDRSVGSFAWKTDSSLIIFAADDRGGSTFCAASPEGKLFYPPELFEPTSPKNDMPFQYDDLVYCGYNLYFGLARIGAPTEIWQISGRAGESYAQPGRVKMAGLTGMNDALLSQIDMQPLESFMFKGANNEEVQGFILKPPGFDQKKKYPLKFLIHGGPQGAWGNEWTYRWNAELFAVGNPETFRRQGGYVVVMINFHGSTGYGQKFTDSISGDWGGKPYIDLMKGLDYVEKTYPFIDKNREAALGASYGGYMANWLLGHTNRFKCIVSHDGTFDTESAYGTTEELWFMNWEFKGPPWKNRELYRKWSPHLSAANFKTPTLVVHGQLDYRLDVSQGFDLFTTLQTMKVPSKMLYFPDEGHWVLKPQNSRLWYKTVNDWVDQWCKR
jgi:dipeptidyl aminopeptidase/acylaminoacyl peptidase